MDRFVTRSPSWKILNHPKVAAQPSNRRSVANKPASRQSLNYQKKPSTAVPNTHDLSRRFSQIFRPVCPPVIENYNGNSNDSGLSSASISPPIMSSGDHVVEPPYSDNTRTPTKQNHLSKLGDYVDCPAGKENDMCMIIDRQKSAKKTLEAKALIDIRSPRNRTLQSDTPVTPPAAAAEKELAVYKNPMLRSRIHRDLNSPSASVRVRALKALASPTKSPYAHFDVPNEEQSFHLSTASDHRDIKDVMRNVVVYVEVRSGEDDRSEGVRHVIEALGARVNLKLNKDTTHVVFKEGRLSTYKKAKQYGIPVVSILWVEACKTNKRLCNVDDFPISNLDRYNNPELYTKFKVFKHMQPGSECTKRKVKTPTLTKHTTPTQKTGNLKKNSTPCATTPTSSFSNQKKTDISQFFKKLGTTNKVLTTPKSLEGDAVSSNVQAEESPATRLLNRITSDCLTPMQQSKSNSKDVEEKTVNKTSNNMEGLQQSPTETDTRTPEPNKAKKVLDFVQSKKEEGAVAITKAPMMPTTKIRRRKGVAAIVNDKESDKLIEVEKLKDTENVLPCVTPTRRSRRRSTTYTPKNMTIETPKHEKLQFEAINEEVNVSEANVKNKELMESADNPDIVKPNDGDDKLNAQAGFTKSGRRRTIYSYKTMNESGIQAALDSTNVTKRRPTCNSVKSIEIDPVATIIGDVIDNCTITPEIGDVTNANVQFANLKQNEKDDTSMKSKVVSSSRRRTLYTPKKTNKVLDLPSTAASVVGTESENVCLTPTASILEGKIAACSTLLDSANKTPALIETPPATAVEGKLLEETEECVTPYLFNSSRLPGNKRRTLFNVSMDIITQRLQCINQSVRRSLNPSAMENINNNMNQKCEDTQLQIRAIDKKGKTVIMAEPDSENSTPTNSKIIDITTTQDCGDSILQNKKRKLFVPNETLTTPSRLIENRRASLSSSSVKLNSLTKRRRTILPFSSQPILSETASTLSQLTVLDEQTSNTPPRKRRSTLDFEQLKNIQNKNQLNNNKGTTADENNDKKEVVKAETKRVLVYTSMHKEQKDVINEAVEKLGKCILEQTVTDSTTHLISLEPRRTMNLLRALVRGLWIVNYNWVLDSMKAGIFLPEEQYELEGFSNSIKICRSERQAFGKIYKCELFHDVGLFYISPQCTPVRREDIIELINLCGGRFSSHPNKARFIIGDTKTALEDNQLNVTPYWVLDSISDMKLMKLNKYLYSKPLERSECL